MQNIGKVLIVVSIILFLIGLLLYLGGDKLKWLGNLPGDVRIEKENFKFYFPITTMLLLSVALSIIIKLIQRFL